MTSSFNNVKKSTNSFKIKENEDELRSAFKRLNTVTHEGVEYEGVHGVIHIMFIIILLVEFDENGMRMQNPLLMEEVRIFDKSALSDTPLLKRNLQPVSSAF